MSFSHAYSFKRQEVTLTNCDREPVHVPGCIQPFGVLLALRPSDRTVLQVSDNTVEWLGRPPESLLGQTLAQVVGAEGDALLAEAVAQQEIGHLPRYLFTFQSPHGRLDALAHQHDGMILIEAEAAGEPALGFHSYSEVNRIAGSLQRTGSLYEFCDTLAHEVRGLTGLDRVMIYRFHEDLSGEVFAEAKRDDLHSYYTLRYPSEDIPHPAREIFRKIWVRPLPAVNYQQSELVPLLNPDTGHPLDMTHCFLRGASVMYTDYLRNMGVEMALTLSIVVDGQLWGLVACHHMTPKIVPWATRAACELLAQMASLQLRAVEHVEHADYRAAMDQASRDLIARMLNEDKTTSQILDGTPDAMDFIESTGTAVFEQGEWTLHGETPTIPQLGLLAEWVQDTCADAPYGAEIFHTHALAERFPLAKDYTAVASGLLAAPISRGGKDLILWFRAEVTKQVNWAGDPYSKLVESSPHGDRLMPRSSFALWQESVRGQSMPWHDVEVAAARRLRLEIIEAVAARTQRVMLQNKELSVSNEELDAFAYVTSHDLREPLRGIYHYAYHLRESALKREDAESVEQAERLNRLVKRMDGLIESLLHFSRVGRVTLEQDLVDMEPMIEETLDILHARIQETRPNIRVVSPLPSAKCDAMRIREIWTNLINNALKYGGERPVVEIGSSVTNRGLAYFVRDYGMGIAEADQKIIFELFKRLHAKDEFGGGVGAGLAIVKKIVERHGGSIWVESKIDEGSTFYFTLRGMVQ